MSRQQEFICGLSHEVTIAVLPRLNMEELMFELSRRIQNLDKENSIKDRLVSILRDVMLVEYRQLERISEVSSPNETTIPLNQGQGTAAMQKNPLTPETSNSDALKQSFGLHSVIKKEHDTNSKVLIHSKPKDLNSDSAQIQSTVSEQDQLCNMPSLGLETLSTPEIPIAQMDSADGCDIKEEDLAMTTADKAVRDRHDEVNIDTPTFSTQVQDTINSMDTFYSEMPVESDTPRACEEAPSDSHHLPPDHGVHVKMEYHVSEDYHIGQMSQPSNPDYSDVRDTAGFINSGHKQCEEDSSEEPPFLSFSKHRQCHEEERPFMCGECGYRARYKYQLVGHMRTHTGEKPLECNQCNYNTSFKRNLVQHMKRHTDAKPYSCELCDYQTFRKSAIEKHIMGHTGVKPHKCEECDYSTVKKSDLIKHKRRHTGERPYSCQKCDYKATVMSNLFAHMRSKHM